MNRLVALTIAAASCALFWAAPAGAHDTNVLTTTTNAAGDVAGSAAEGAGDVAGSATRATGEAIGGPVEAAGDVAGDAAETAGNVAKKTINFTTGVLDSIF